ncbi:sporulation histidine kinase inhibitor Sda [Halalkalibacter oceani]|uniref:Sporulation histidine kinase inhibitor Sda n=1 Tax=Halalkalibacter oceani TaxID=1653776 RepID=A0A9X2DL58_9BACI|nr:sporulation histidine kinase inhibitor Sda [Halalkalibacter oceani]MCM3712751.1 sporulation histidine kinase inhibitor Sda [Halalkalibacter oceani]
MLRHLDNETIIEAYFRAIELNVNEDFLLLLKKELIRRDLFNTSFSALSSSRPRV